jgi:polar amino acid transport system permease protein
MKALPNSTDLPVLLAPAALPHQQDEMSLSARIFTPKVAFGLALVFALSICLAEAQAQSATISREGVLATMAKWAPLIFQGFLFNILVSFMSMAIGTLAGTLLGLAQISLFRPVRRTSWYATQFFRNAPWLVLLFYCMFLLPFKFTLFGVTIPFPDWIKATIGLSLPVMANVSEIVRGAIQSIPTGQWEASGSLAFTRRQTLWMIVLPQSVKRMLPPWMNLYCILAVGTVLASVVGVQEVMTLTGDALSSENRPELLMPFYGFVLLLFFAYCYPIARWTVFMEKKYAVPI